MIIRDDHDHLTIMPHAWMNPAICHAPPAYLMAMPCQSKTSTWDPLLSHGFVSLHPLDPTLLLKQLILEPLISPVNSWSTAFNSVGRACPSLVPLPLSTIVHGASQQNKVTWILSLTIDPIKFSVLSFTSFSPSLINWAISDLVHQQQSDLFERMQSDLFVKVFNL